jgi:phosphatidylglycerophosphate synthase
MTGPEHGEVPSRAIILLGPDFEVQIAGLGVLQRMIYALERAGVRSITLLLPEGEDAPAGRLLTCANETQLVMTATAKLEGPTRENVVLFLWPVVLDAAAAGALMRLTVASDRVQAIDTVDRFANPVATGVYLIPEEGRVDVAGMLTAATGGNHDDGKSMRTRLPAGVCYPLVPGGGPGVRLAAERALLASMRRPTDGFLAYFFDRRISTAISRYLVRTAITPNQISVLTLFPALAGALLIAVPDPIVAVVGALLYWFSTILDGCDGEVARLKYLESADGGRLDLLCDNFGLLALFIGIVLHVHAERPGAILFYAGAAIVAGMVAAMAIEYWWISRPKLLRQGVTERLRPADRRRQELYQRFASRDFAYLLPILAFTGTLSWLVWATAIGVNVFWMALLAIVIRGAVASAATTARPS